MVKWTQKKLKSALQSDPKWPKSDSNMGSGVTFDESILGHIGVGLPESLLESLCVSVQVRPRTPIWLRLRTRKPSEKVIFAWQFNWRWRRNDSTHKICVRGPSRGTAKIRQNCPKTLFFLGNSLTIKFEKFSGKKKAHKHKSFWPVTPPVTGGSPDREARGQSFMCYPRNPRNINLFVRIPDREDRWPGRPGKVLCAKVLCAFSAP